MRSDVADATGNVAYDVVDTNMGGGGGGRLCPWQFLFWRAKASCPRYLSMSVLHTQNFLIYITGLFILMLVRERCLKPHIRCKVSLKLGW